MEDVVTTWGRQISHYTREPWFSLKNFLSKIITRKKGNWNTKTVLKNKNMILRFTAKYETTVDRESGLWIGTE